MLAPLQDFSVAGGGRVFALAELEECSRALARRFPLPARACLALQGAEAPLLAAAMLWAWREELSLIVLPAEMSAARAATLAGEAGAGWLLRATEVLEAAGDPLPAPSSPAAARPASLCVLSSGTTGVPKAVWHAWTKLRQDVSLRPEQCGVVWLSMFPLSRFAGINSLLQAIWSGSRFVFPAPRTPAGCWAATRENAPTHVTGTPTLWRYWLMAAAEERRHASLRAIRQISLGGEIADQGLLDALHRLCPQARLTHLYATTESGVAFAVSDGRAGFPRQWLDDAERRIPLQVREECLWMRLGSGGDAHWWNTQDRVAMTDDRVLFRGRLSDVINVGGAKVAPVEVEACIAEVAGVAAVRVRAQANSLCGALLVADVIPTSASSPGTLKGEIARHCRAHLPAYAVPRLIELVVALPLAASGKVAREEKALESA